MQGVPVVSTLKLRASCGETGNQGIGDFAYQGLFGSANYGDTPGIAPSQPRQPGPQVGDDARVERRRRGWAPRAIA